MIRKLKLIRPTILAIALSFALSGCSNDIQDTIEQESSRTVISRIDELYSDDLVSPEFLNDIYTKSEQIAILKMLNKYPLSSSLLLRDAKKIDIADDTLSDYTTDEVKDLIELAGTIYLFANRETSDEVYRAKDTLLTLSEYIKAALNLDGDCHKDIEDLLMNSAKKTIASAFGCTTSDVTIAEREDPASEEYTTYVYGKPYTVSYSKAQNLFNVMGYLYYLQNATVKKGFASSDEKNKLQTYAKALTLAESALAAGATVQDNNIISRFTTKECAFPPAIQKQITQ